MWRQNPSEAFGSISASSKGEIDVDEFTTQQFERWNEWYSKRWDRFAL
jgi:hypothetical protein